MVNISDFTGHIVLITTTQLCCYSANAAIDNLYTNEHGCAPIKLHRNSHQIWSKCRSLPTPILDYCLSVDLESLV